MKKIKSSHNESAHQNQEPSFETSHQEELNKILNGKNILITGGTGSIGSEIARQLIPFNPKQIRIYSRDESKQFFFQQELSSDKYKSIRFLIGDTRDKERLDLALNEIDIVFHAAALKHVPFCEYNPFEAVKTNVNGTQNLIDLSIQHKVERVIAISTDKAVNPNTVMGITKLLMERLVINAHNYTGQTITKFSVVRFGNVLYSRGSVIPMWIEQIKKGGPVTVTDKRMCRFFITIPQAVQLVFQALIEMQGGEIFVLKMKEFNMYELAQKIIKEHAQGKQIPITIIGSRTREKLKEHLFTEEEATNIIQKKDYYIIRS